MKIPLTPPFSKGELLLPFIKGGREGFKKAIRRTSKSKKKSPHLQKGEGIMQPGHRLFLKRILPYLNRMLCDFPS